MRSAVQKYGLDRGDTRKCLLEGGWKYFKKGGGWQERGEKKLRGFVNLCIINPIQDEHFRGCSQMGGGAKRPPSLKSVTDILQ